LDPAGFTRKLDDRLKMATLALPSAPLQLPEFLPDATRGFVRAVDSQDLEDVGVKALVMNTFHLMQNPGSSTIQSLGGLHRMSGWKGPIITDSGGFQIYSLIHENSKFGSLNNKGATFHIGEGGQARKFVLTPEKSIQLQLGYETDVVICLDDCTHVDAPYQDQLASVERTVHWARRSKAEFNRLIEERQIPTDRRPLIFAVVQGGGSAELRKRCAGQLLEIGFDGYGFGGWPLDSQGNLLLEMLELTRRLVPYNFPLHALGVASPANVLACARLGYDIFDGAMPTRDARHARLYAFQIDPAVSTARLTGDWLTYIYAQDARHLKANLPVSPFCDCLLCRRYSLGYLHHLLKAGDSLALRLATIHNLRFMAQLSAYLRVEI
jgi:queuine tRNA-ribosyltransferase